MTSFTTPFTEYVYWFLIDEGYTHLYLKGLERRKEAAGDAFRVVPLIPEDPQIELHTADGLVVQLDHAETLDLTRPIPDIVVVVEWTIGQYAAYLLVQT